RGAPGYYVEVTAQQDDDLGHQTVQDDNGVVYTARSAVVDETVEPDKTGLDVHAAAADSGPAFNIFDAGVSGALLVRSALGVVPPQLTWVWTRGQRGSCIGSVSCYHADTKTISVLSSPTDPDEYDDMVLLHQFGHFFLDTYSGSNDPGGDHPAATRVDP